jgi:hypothetical protein
MDTLLGRMVAFGFAILVSWLTGLKEFGEKLISG